MAPNSFHITNIAAAPAAPAAAAPVAAAPAPAATPAPAAVPTAAAPVAVAAGETAVKSPMPGNIFKVECSVGQSVKAGDVLVGLSTSGNSANIVKAFETCHEKAITTVAFTGADGGRMRELTKLLINVPSTDTPRIQEAHITIGHIICELVEEEIFGKE